MSNWLFSSSNAPLMRRFVTSVILLSFVAGMIMSVIMANVQLQSLYDEKYREANSQLEKITDSAAYAAFNLDSTQGYSLLKGFEKDSLFSEVILLDNYGDIVAKASKTPSSSTENWYVSFLPSYETSTINHALTFPVFRDGKHVDSDVGSLVGSIDYVPTADEFHQLIWTIFLSTSVEIFMTAVFLCVFFQRQIGKPLSNIIQHIDDNSHIDRTNRAKLITVAGHEKDEFGRLIRAYNTSIDHAAKYMNKLERTKAELKALSEKDPLTGLANRRALLSTLSALCEQNSRFAVVSLDIDNFGGINDAYGHQLGDELLTTLAEILQSTLKDTAIISRPGGDEFIIVFNNYTTPEALVEQLNPVLNVPLHREDINNTQWITTSIGVTVYPQDAHTPQRLLHCTDIALYVAKDAGRKCIRFYDEDADLERSRRDVTRKKLQKIIENDDFYLEYQPKVSMHSGEVVGCEALLRLNSDTKQDGAPVEIIEEAEKNGLIVALGQAILRRAFSDLSHYLDALPEHFRMSVNVSPKQLVSDQFISDLLMFSEEFNVPLTRIDIEITESCQIFDTEKSYKVRHWLKNAGVTVTLDDFGTGFASLEYLLTYGFDQIKVDRHFTQALPRDEDAKAIFSVVQYLADKLNMGIIAEGIENIDQQSYLQHQGFDYVQGYFYSKSLPIQDLMSFLENRHLVSPAIEGAEH
ncbi:hypothetical protein BCT23_19325 [Enterovibrio norvegicus]|uniref:Diguanylate phosphodiesterase n=2 Tax=Enterovibrio norvegicus TaxID=188144 RepID=A0A2N7L954_9GAMM|nr:hypothetical protein BCT23_19325 [Enterovibrio norvegicus]